MSELRWGRYCLACNIRYTELTSIGKLQCLFHPLPLNRNGSGHNYEEGRYDCCGYSPYPNLPNGQRNPHFDSNLIKGCVRKDHSATQYAFTEADNLPYHTWPELLRLEMDSDLQKLVKGESNIVHLGLDIGQNEQIFVRRYDLLAKTKMDEKHKVLLEQKKENEDISNEPKEKNII